MEGNAMTKEYQITLCITPDNRGKAVVHEVTLPPLLEEGDVEISIYNRMVFEMHELENMQIEDLPVFAEATACAHEKAQTFQRGIQPIGVIHVLP